LGAFAAVYAKTAEPIEMPFGGLAHVDPSFQMEVKVGRGVKRRRCGLSSKFFDHLLIKSKLQLGLRQSFSVGLEDVFCELQHQKSQ